MLITRRRIGSLWCLGFKSFHELSFPQHPSTRVEGAFEAERSIEAQKRTAPPGSRWLMWWGLALGAVYQDAGLKLKASVALADLANSQRLIASLNDSGQATQDCPLSARPRFYRRFPLNAV